jgi:Uma2 family endonuclease
VADVVGVLAVWRADHPEFVVGTNEAGMLLGGEVRAADAAVRRRADLSAPTGGFPRVAPILAIEVAGRDDTIELLSAKARWYLSHGTAVVWLLDPPRRVVHVVTPEGEHELGAAQLVPPIAALPGLRTTVAALFAQLVEG